MKPKNILSSLSIDRPDQAAAWKKNLAEFDQTAAGGPAAESKRATLGIAPAAFIGPEPLLKKSFSSLSVSPRGFRIG